MSLTTLTLTIDQRRPGWAERARSEANMVLAAAGLAAMAAEVGRVQPSVGELPGALARYLRLNVIAGEAAPQAVCVQPLGTAGRARYFATPLAERMATAWRAKLPAPLAYPPALAGDVVVVLDEDRGLAGFDLHSGEELWRRDRHCFPGATAPSVSADRIALCSRPWVSSHPGTLFVLDAQSGRTLWHATPPYDSRRDGAEALLVGERVLHGGGGLDATLTCYAAETGELLWKHTAESELLYGPAVEGETVVVTDRENLSALSLANGGVLWRRPVSALQCGAPVVGDGYALTCDLEPGVCCFDLATGALAWARGPLDDGSLTILVGGGKAYLCNELGRVTILSLSSGQVLDTTFPPGNERVLVGEQLAYLRPDGGGGWGAPDAMVDTCWSLGEMAHLTPVVTPCGRLLVGGEASLHCLEPFDELRHDPPF